MSYPQPNEHGVYLREDCEVLELSAAEGAEGKRKRMVIPSCEILLVQAYECEWLASAAYCLHAGDFRTQSALPHDESEQCFPGRDSALRAMAEYLLAQMDRVFKDRDAAERRAKGYPPGYSKSRINPSLGECREAERVARWAARLLGIAAPEQLELELALA